MSRTRSTLVSLAALSAAGGAFAVAGRAVAPPVGPLPAGPTARIATVKGELIAFALPHRSGGRVWRVARRFDAGIVRQVSEADVGNQVVLVFEARGTGTTTVAFGLTRGERARAYESRRYTIDVRSR